MGKERPRGARVQWTFARMFGVFESYVDHWDNLIVHEPEVRMRVLLRYVLKREEWLDETVVPNARMLGAKIQSVLASIDDGTVAWPSMRGTPQWEQFLEYASLIERSDVVVIKADNGPLREDLGMEVKVLEDIAVVDMNEGNDMMTEDEDMADDEAEPCVEEETADEEVVEEVVEEKVEKVERKVERRMEEDEDDDCVVLDDPGDVKFKERKEDVEYVTKMSLGTVSVVMPAIASETDKLRAVAELERRMMDVDWAKRKWDKHVQLEMQRIENKMMEIELMRSGSFCAEGGCMCRLTRAELIAGGVEISDRCPGCQHYVNVHPGASSMV